MRQLAASRCDPAAVTWSTFTEFAARDLARIPVGTIFGREHKAPCATIITQSAIVLPGFC